MKNFKDETQIYDTTRANIHCGGKRKLSMHVFSDRGQKSKVNRKG